MDLARRITKHLAFGTNGTIPHPEYLPEQHGDTEVDFLDFIASTRHNMNRGPDTRLLTGPKAKAKGQPRPTAVQGAQSDGRPRQRTRSRGQATAVLAPATQEVLWPAAPAQGNAARRPSQGRSVRQRGMEQSEQTPALPQHTSPPLGCGLKLSGKVGC